MENLSEDSLKLANLLAVLASQNPNQEELKEASAILKEYSSTPQSIEGYIIQLQKNENANSRQLAAVMLNKKFESRFSELSQEIQTNIANALFEIYIAEKVSIVSRAIATVVFKVIKTSLINDHWNKACEMLFTDPSQFGNEHLICFENNIYILSLVIDSCAELVKPKLSNILKTISISLQLGSDRMKQNAAICIGNLVESYSLKDLESFKSLLNDVFGSIKSFDETAKMKLFEIFSKQGYKAIEFFEGFNEFLFLEAISILKDDLTSEELKMVLSDYLFVMAELEKKLFKKNHYEHLKNVIQIGYLLACQSEENVEHDVNFGTGLRILQVFSETFSSKFVFPFCVENIKNLITSSNWIDRKVAISSIGSVSTGCSEKIKDNLKEIVDMLVTTFKNDPNESVKGACIITIDFLKNSTEPDIDRFQDVILPLFVEALSDNDEKIVIKALIGIKNYCDADNVEIDIYFESILNKTISYIINPNSSIPLQQESLFALTSVLSTVNTIDCSILIPILEKCIFIFNNANYTEQVFLLANAMDCVAEITIKVGKDLLKPFLGAFVDHANDFIQSKTYEFQDAGFNFFNKMSTVLKAEFAPYLTSIMPRAFELLLDDSGLTRIDNKDDAGIDSDSEIEDDEAINFNNNFIDAKSSVILAVSFFCESCPIEFYQYLPKLLNKFDQLWNYAHENITIEIAKGYSVIMRSLNQLKDQSEQISAYVINLWVSNVFPKYSEIIQDTDSRVIVAEVLLCFSLLIKELGSTLLNNQQLSCLLNLIKTLLKYEAFCQVKNEEADDDEIDPDEEVMKAITEVILMSVDVYGNNFKDGFVFLSDSLLKYLAKGRSTSDKDFAISIFAYVFKGCPVLISIYGEKLLSLCQNFIKEEIKEETDKLTRNCAFLIGVLFQKNYSQFASQYSVIVELLSSVKTEDQGTKDNLIVALMRIIRGSNFDTSLPGFENVYELVVSSVPLINDVEENKEVSEFFIEIFGRSAELFLQVADKAFKSVLFCLGEPDKVYLTAQEEKQLIEFLKITQKDYGKIIEANLGLMSEVTKANVLSSFAKY